MTSIVDVGAYIPDERIAIRDIAPELGIGKIELGVFERFFGLRDVCRANDEDLTDILVAAAKDLRALRGNEHRVRYVIGGRTLPTVAPVGVNPLHETADRLGLSHSIVWTVTQQACASAMLAVDMAGRLLTSDGDDDGLALVFAGEKAQSPRSRFLGGMTLMGEGTAACLVSAGSSGAQVLSFATKTLGAYHYLPLPDELAGAFGELYTVVLGEVIMEAVVKAGLSLEDLALVLPHNVNRVSWKKLSRHMGLPFHKIRLDDVPVTGHCFGADSFIGYAAVRQAGVLQPGSYVLMAAVGLGATFSAMVLRYEESAS